MVETVIKNFTIIICSIYSYRKLLHFERVSKVNGILTFTFSLASAFSVYAIRLHDPLLSLLIMITLLPFRLKRLRKGMPFLRKIGSTNAGVLISIALLCSVILISTRQFTPSIFILLYLSIHLFSVFVFLWWRSRIKQSYLEGVRKLEKEELQDTYFYRYMLP